jgi:hypothetical protein
MKHHRNDDGSVLFSVVGLCAAMSVIGATLLLVATMNAKVEHLGEVHDEAYWLARGGMWQTVRSFKHGTRPAPHVTESSPNGHLKIDIQYDTLWGVHVTATTQDATVTLTGTYDPMHQVLVQWQENAPAE